MLCNDEIRKDFILAMTFSNFVFRQLSLFPSKKKKKFIMEQKVYTGFLKKPST